MSEAQGVNADTAAALLTLAICMAAFAPLLCVLTLEGYGRIKLRLMERRALLEGVIREADAKGRRQGEDGSEVRGPGRKGPRCPVERDVQHVYEEDAASKPVERVKPEGCQAAAVRQALAVLAECAGEEQQREDLRAGVQGGGVHGAPGVEAAAGSGGRGSVKSPAGGVDGSVVVHPTRGTEADREGAGATSREEAVSGRARRVVDAAGTQGEEVEPWGLCVAAAVGLVEVTRAMDYDELLKRELGTIFPSMQLEEIAGKLRRVAERLGGRS